jgi:calcineurin-like phosphoesterase family protein
MRDVYVISDLHLGHTNMALRRGFNSVEEHDNYIINTWNNTVTKRDTIWILGDISLEKSKEYSKLKLLKGYKKVLLGNHELCRRAHNTELLNYVNCIGGYIISKHDGFILSHIPIHPSELRGCINIHGHIHEEKINDSRYINVSCEAINYKPQLLSEILKKNSIE